MYDTPVHLPVGRGQVSVEREKMERAAVERQLAEKIKEFTDIQSKFEALSADINDRLALQSLKHHNTLRKIDENWLTLTPNIPMFSLMEWRLRHGNVVSRVCLCICLSVCLSVCNALTFDENLDLKSSFLVCKYIFRLSRSGLYIRVIGQGQGQGHKSKKACLFAMFAL